VLCLACVASYAQTRKKKKVTKKQNTQQTVVNPPSTTTSAIPVDTSKKLAKSGKHFDRPLDGYYKKSNILSAKVTPYPNLRENDVAFAKRVWREIDVREKMNAYMASPKQRLIDVIMNAVAAGELTAYSAIPDKDNDPDGDAFYAPLTPEKAKNAMADSVPVDKFDKDGNKIGTIMKGGEINPDSVVKFRIKEDWVFDRQRSIFEPRIIGLAPMIKVKVGTSEEYQPAFWLYFPDARPIFAVKEVVSHDNDNTGLSFDDIFMKRIFTSYIVKESNDKDNRIKDYATGIDKLYESERIKKSLQDWELNLWQY